MTYLRLKDSAPHFNFFNIISLTPKVVCRTVALLVSSPHGSSCNMLLYMLATHVAIG